ncbi:small Trp-rich protein [Noviherbaspirillum humi]|uniref:Small Trp-rich protein n=1 Tax=Noviherbaspirillum humi TaxID=1688639 RepID=A0A239IXA8_9BURK|nr:TIGR04438 family Trp-rich protein [Noviherbaspirillum humi]SNS98406.1 small Trp-rich protein [Noviherbaspirillum humi]
MPLIIAIVVLALLRFFEVGLFAHMSWWWVIGLFGVAFVWFELIEKWLGMDQRKAVESLERARKDRVSRTFKR